MPVELTMSMSPHESRVIMRLTSQMKPNIRRALTRAGVILERQIKANLTGPGAVRGVKGRPTPGQGFSGGGGLRGSVQFQVSADGMTMRVGPGGIAKKYAAIHEFGGLITQTVTPKQHWFLGLAKDIWVGIGSTLTIPIPARPYVSTAWKAKQREVMDAIQTELMRGI